MTIRVVFFMLALFPAVALAQSPPTAHTNKPPNATTRAVLLANRPEHFTEAEWLKRMEQPVHRSLYPLRITQAMLDTLDLPAGQAGAKQLDLRYQYTLVKELPVPVAPPDR